MRSEGLKSPKSGSDRYVPIPSEAWVTSSLKYSRRFDEISAEQAVISARVGNLCESGSYVEGSMALRDFATGIGLSYSLLLLVVFGLIAVVLEMATYSMLRGRCLDPRVPVSRDALVLETSYQGQDKPLLGRRKVAAKLGVDQNEIRKTLRQLARMGVVCIPRGAGAVRPKAEIPSELSPGKEQEVPFLQSGVRQRVPRQLCCPATLDSLGSSGLVGCGESLGADRQVCGKPGLVRQSVFAHYDGIGEYRTKSKPAQGTSD